jgi:hypothetical protein
MCYILLINLGEKKIKTPRQFLEHFGFEGTKRYIYQSVDLDGCLCQVDIDDALKTHSIPYKRDCGDYFVGELDEIVGDSD